MRDARIRRTSLASSPSPIRVTAGERRGLPADLVEEASHRLGIAALLYSACYFLAYGSSFLASDSFYFATVPTVAGVLLSHVVAAISILVSLLIFVVSRSGKLSAAVLCEVGLFYEVAGAVGIDFHLTWMPITPDMTYGGISWVCVWMVLFVLIVPNTPGKTLLAALATASVTPLLLLIGMARETADPSLGLAVQLSVPNYLCAFMAFIGARIIYQLGSQVTEARRMGSYELVEMLGRGGMGEVWRAKHRMLVRPAAIKLIRPETLGEDNTEEASKVLLRFEREAQATAALHSTHTITLYDFGMTDEGYFYYVMELLRGVDLESMVQRFGPTPPNRTIYLLKQVCHSLGDAHRHGLIHRDIKPANIYASRLGPDYDFVKVLDFGLVKSHQPAAEDATQLTMQGITTGTPGYMAPEMALDRETVDGRTDLYALGCVGYWLLTGQLVFPGKNPMQVLLHHVKTEPTPPSQRSELEIPLALDELILRCLEKDPAKRPATAEELSRLLEDCWSGETWTQEEAASWWQLHIPEHSS